METELLGGVGAGLGSSSAVFERAARNDKGDHTHETDPRDVGHSPGHDTTDP